jgi:hypothetical protein
MFELTRHMNSPDLGVIASDLFIYDAKAPGTGGLVTKITPGALPQRETVLIKTPELQISFWMDRDANTAEAILVSATEPAQTHRQSFHLVDDFQSKPNVSITILFGDWKIVAVVDGKPLLLRH